MCDDTKPPKLRFGNYGLYGRSTRYGTTVEQALKDTSTRVVELATEKRDLSDRIAQLEAQNLALEQRPTAKRKTGPKGRLSVSEPEFKKALLMYFRDAENNGRRPQQKQIARLLNKSVSTIYRCAEEYFPGDDERSGWDRALDWAEEQPMT